MGQKGPITVHAGGLSRCQWLQVQTLIFNQLSIVGDGDPNLLQLRLVVNPIDFFVY